VGRRARAVRQWTEGSFKKCPKRDLSAMALCLQIQDGKTGREDRGPNRTHEEDEKKDVID